MIRDEQKIGAACRALRALRAVSQPEFAKRVGISEATLRELEKGTLGTASKYVLAIANAAGITLDDFERLASLYVESSERFFRIGVEG